jgi:hypothetical protein
MAFCTRCKGEIDPLAVECPRCGWDFAENPGPPVHRGLGSTFVYSPLAEAALVVGQLVAGLGCVLALGGTIVALISGNWLAALVQGPLTFFVLLALLVVFLRVQDLRPSADLPRRLPRLTDRFAEADARPEQPSGDGIQPPPK